MSDSRGCWICAIREQIPEEGKLLLRPENHVEAGATMVLARVLEIGAEGVKHGLCSRHLAMVGLVTSRPS